MAEAHRRHVALLYEITERVADEIRGLRSNGLSQEDNRLKFKLILRTATDDVKAATAAYDAELKKEGGAE